MNPPPAQPTGCLPSLLTGPVWTVLRRLARLGSPTSIGRGVALRGAVWVGGEPSLFDGSVFDGVVVVGGDGRIAAVGPTGQVPLPEGVPVVDCAWVGPGITDAHVHLSAGVSGGADGGALVAVRDLGSPAANLATWRSMLPLVVVGSGPVLVGGPALAGGSGGGETGVGASGGGGRSAGVGSAGVGSAGVGSAGVGASPTAVDGAPAARRVVAALVAEGVDLVEVRVDDHARPGRRGPAGLGGPTDSPGVVGDGLRTVVAAAHAAGLPVVAHALTAAGVRTALAAGVDEFAHVPVEPLSDELVDRIAAAGVAVVSTLQRHAADGPGPGRNAAALHRAGVPLVYGADGGHGTGRAVAPGDAAGRGSGAAGGVGVDPRELDRLAYAGLGRLGALRAATSGAAQAAGLAGRAPSGRIKVGDRAALVGLYADPLIEPAAWRAPAIVVRGPALTTGRPLRSLAVARTRTG